MASIIEYECPCCGGGITFDSQVQKMKCPYCGSEFEMDALDSFKDELAQEGPDELTWEETSESDWNQQEMDHLKRYQCKSCGAEILGDETLASTKCPYCDSPIVMQEQFFDDLKPDYVIPFKLDKKAAKEKLREHLSGKKLLPKVFLDENHIDEIKGVYVPFWLFDTDADAQIRYHGTKTRVWHDRDYQYTEVNHFAILRKGTLGYDMIPVDGTTKLSHELMESLEPFDMKDAVPFKTAYLAGYSSDRYDIDAKSSEERANTRVKNSTRSAFASTVHGFENVSVENMSIQLKNGKVQYALYPVWILNTTWKGEKYIFAMNGQTGKFVGDLPEDKSIGSKYLTRITLGVGIGLTALARLIWFFI